LVGRDAMALADLCQRFLQIVGRLHHGERRAFRHTDVSLLFHSLANGHAGKSVPNTLCQACESSWEHFHVRNTFCVYPEEPGAAKRVANMEMFPRRFAGLTKRVGNRFSGMAVGKTVKQQRNVSVAEDAALAVMRAADYLQETLA